MRSSIYRVTNQTKSLSSESVLEDIEEYDSMSKLSITVLIDDEFGKKLTGERLREFKTVGDIPEFI